MEAIVRPVWREHKCCGGAEVDSKMWTLQSLQTTLSFRTRTTTWLPCSFAESTTELGITVSAQDCWTSQTHLWWDEPLTPSHLLTGHRIWSLPDNPKPSEDDEEFILNGHRQLTRRARHLNHTLNIFWNRWWREYLLELQEAHRYYQWLFPLKTVEESDESELSGTEDVGEDNVTPAEDNVNPKTSTEEETRRWPSCIAAQVALGRLLAQTLADNWTTQLILLSPPIVPLILLLSYWWPHLWSRGECVRNWLTIINWIGHVIIIK